MTGAGWIALIIIGVLAGLLAAYVRISGRTMPGGWIVGILLGLLGAYLGGVYLGKWGWVLGGLNVIGSIIVALLIPYIVEALSPKATT